MLMPYLNTYGIIGSMLRELITKGETLLNMYYLLKLHVSLWNL